MEEFPTAGTRGFVHDAIVVSAGASRADEWLIKYSSSYSLLRYWRSQCLLPHNPIDAQAQIAQLISKRRAVQPETLASVAEMAAGFLQYTLK